MISEHRLDGLERHRATDPWDVEGRLTVKTYADNSTLTFTYEIITSRLKSVTDALGQTRQLAYAKDDRVTAISYLNAVHPTPNVAFAYDPYFPRRISMADGTGITSYAYAPVGSLGALRLQQETTPLGNGMIAYGYDALGRLASRAVAGQGAETFAYDAIGRLTGHGSDLGSFTLAYLGQTSQIASRTLTGSNLATTWSYLSNANDRRLASVATTGLTAGQSSTFSYVTNAEDQTTGQTQTSEISIAYPPGSLLQTASYNNLNQLTNLTGQAQTFDADGNLTSDGTRTYSWDAENRLIAIAYPGQPGKATAFAYDGLGRRVQMSSTPIGGGSALVTSYLWCGTKPCQARNASDAPTRGYYAEGEFVPGSPSVSDYYAPDRIGSMRRVYSASSAPTYDYDPYGNALQATAPVTDYGYAGMIANADSGLYLTTYRPYDPVSGRFLLRDPIGEAGDPLGNLYAYVGGDPVDGTDAAGLLGPPIYGPYAPPFAWPQGVQIQVGASLSGALVGPAAGTSGALNAGVSIDPSNPLNSEFFAQSQVAAGAGTGLFAGGGGGGFASVGPAPSNGFRASRYAEADAGAPGISGSASGMFGNKGIATAGIGGAGRFSIGPGGAGAFVGAAGAYTLGITLRCLFTQVIPAILAPLFILP